MNYYLQSIESVNFRNHSQIHSELHPKLNFIVGPNAAGKTSLLDAIHYLSFTKGFLSPTDQENININSDFFIIKGFFQRNESTEEVFCSLKRNEKKQFKRNSNDYQRLSDHIGLFPLTIVSPYDFGLIQGGSDERRKYIDSVICQLNKEYLNNLLKYNRILKQRNVLLKNELMTYLDKKETVLIYNEQLVALGNEIYKARVLFFDDFLTHFQSIYARLSGKDEDVSIVYLSQLNEDSYDSLLVNSFERDINSGNTSAGIHKDDLQFRINSMPVKWAGSQGQQKTFLTSLKLAQFNYMKRLTGIAPILLLDDIFDKLDDKRVSNLLSEVINDRFGQIFISHTNINLLKNVLGEINSEYFSLYLENGLIYEK